MVLKFQNKFFSLAGQKERIKNVVGVLKAPFTGGKVQSHTGIKAIDKVLSTAATHPIATAAVTGTVANIPKAVKVVQTARAAKAATSAAGNKAGILQKNEQKKSSKGAGGLIDLNELPSAKAATAVFPNAITGGMIKENTTAAMTSQPRATRTRKRSKAAPRRARKRKSSRKSSRRGYGTARQYARPGGRSVKYTKNGQPYIILSDGRARFVKGRRKK